MSKGNKRIEEYIKQMNKETGKNYKWVKGKGKQSDCLECVCKATERCVDAMCQGGYFIYVPTPLQDNSGVIIPTLTEDNIAELYEFKGVVYGWKKNTGGYSCYECDLKYDCPIEWSNCRHGYHYKKEEVSKVKRTAKKAIKELRKKITEIYNKVSRLEQMNKHVLGLFEDNNTMIFPEGLMPLQKLAGIYGLEQGKEETDEAFEKRYKKVSSQGIDRTTERTLIDLPTTIKVSDEDLCILNNRQTAPTKDTIEQPNSDKGYYYIDADLDVLWSNSPQTSYNHFDTRKAAEKGAKMINAYLKLAKIADDLNDGWVPNWNKGEENWKYYIVAIGRRYKSISDLLVHNPMTVYFKSAELADKAIGMMGKELDYLIPEGKENK